MTTYNLARAVAENDTIIWLSTPEADITALESARDECYQRALRAGLDHGRASSEYAAADTALTNATNDLETALALVDPTVADIVLDTVLQIDAEFVVIQAV